MSAAEIIEQIKSLPPQERDTVAEYVREASKTAPQSPEVRYMDEATFRAAKERVFEKHAELFRRLAQ